MGTLLSIAFSAAVLVAIALTVAGLYILIRRPRERIKGLLMIAVAIVTFANVWLLTAPI